MSNTIAATTLSQLAGVEAGGFGRLKAMIGAKDFIWSKKDNYVAFKFMQGASNKANHIKITLNGKDLYDVEFIRIWGTSFKTIDKATDLYNDQLKGYFEENTGLYLSL